MRTRKRSARKYQQLALTWASGRPSIALFMEMRLGKTLVAIRWISERAAPPILVVAPLTVLPVWEEELRKEGIRNIEYLRPAKKCKGVADGTFKLSSSYYLTNYEFLRSRPQLLKHNWRGILLDESTKIKNPQASITRLLVSRTSHIPNRAILCGQPAPESLLEYYPQMNFLNSGKGWMGCENYWRFRVRYFHPDWTGYGWQPNRNTYTKMCDSLRPFAFSLTRKEVSLDTPKTYEVRYVEMNPRQKKAYLTLEKEFRFETKSGSSMLTFLSITKLIWMARIAGGFGADGSLMSTAKCDELISLLNSELKGQKVVVWFRFRKEISYVLSRLLQCRFKNVSTITGDTPQYMRARYIEQFNSPLSRSNILLAQVKCGRYGINLSHSCDTAVYYSNDFSWEDRAQSEDRILDPTRKTPLLYIDLVTRQTVDQDILRTLRSKKLSSGLFFKTLVQNWRERNEKIAIQ